MEMQASKKSLVDLRNLLEPNKIIPVYLERKEAHKASLPPFSIEFHLTSTCNYKCYHCSYAKRNSQKIYVHDVVVDGLVDDIIVNCKPRGVYFSGGGEPTTLKKWDKYIEKFAINNVDVSLITNGSNITHDNIGVMSLLSYISVSIYSSDREIYKKITGGNCFDKYFELPAMLKKQERHPVVGARCVINKFNYRDILNIYNNAISSGYDYVIFIPEIDYENRGLALTVDEVSYIVETFLPVDFDPKNTNMGKILNGKLLYYQDAIGYDVNSLCESVQLRTNAFVNYDGQVYLCQPHVGNVELSIGRISEDVKFSDVWNSERHGQVALLLQEKWKQGGCVNCRAISYNKSIQKYKMLPDNTPMTIVKDAFL